MADPIHNNSDNAAHEVCAAASDSSGHPSPLNPATPGSANGSHPSPHGYVNPATPGSANGSHPSPPGYVHSATPRSSNGSHSSPHSYLNPAFTPVATLHQHVTDNAAFQDPTGFVGAGTGRFPGPVPHGHVNPAFTPVTASHQQVADNAAFQTPTGFGGAGTDLIPGSVPNPPPPQYLGLGLDPNAHARAVALVSARGLHPPITGAGMHSQAHPGSWSQNPPGLWSQGQPPPALFGQGPPQPADLGQGQPALWSLAPHQGQARTDPSPPVASQTWQGALSIRIKNPHDEEGQRIPPVRRSVAKRTKDNPRPAPKKQKPAPETSNAQAPAPAVAAPLPPSEPLYPLPVHVYSLNLEQLGYLSARDYIQALISQRWQPREPPVTRWHAHVTEGFIPNGDLNTIIVLENAFMPFKTITDDPNPHTTSIGLYESSAEQIFWWTVEPLLFELYPEIMAGRINLVHQWHPKAQLARDKRFHKGLSKAASMGEIKDLLNRGDLRPEEDAMADELQRDSRWTLTVDSPTEEGYTVFDFEPGNDDMEEPSESEAIEIWKKCVEEFKKAEKANFTPKIKCWVVGTSERGMLQI